MIELQYRDLYFGFRCDPEAAYLHSSQLFKTCKSHSQVFTEFTLSSSSKGYGLVSVLFTRLLGYTFICIVHGLVPAWWKELCKLLQIAYDASDNSVSFVQTCKSNTPKQISELIMNRS